MGLEKMKKALWYNYVSLAANFQVGLGIYTFNVCMKKLVTFVWKCTTGL